MFGIGGLLIALCVCIKVPKTKSIRVQTETPTESVGVQTEKVVSSVELAHVVIC